MPSRRRRSGAGRPLLILLLLAVLCSLAGITFSQIWNPPYLPPADSQLSLLDRLTQGTYLVTHREELLMPAGDPEALIGLTVDPGELAGSVVARLQEAGVVSDGRLLEAYLRYSGMDRGVEAGRYYLYGGMTVPQIAAALQTARPSEIVIVVPEGWRLEQIAEALPYQELTFSAADFLAAASSRPLGYSFSGELPEPPTLEGFLFPDTYHLDPTLSAKDLVTSMLDNFETQLGSDIRAGIQQQGLTLRQAVILASIIEREAMFPDEHPLMASVFLNRLRNGMRLDADATVQYALGLQSDGGWWKSPLTAADLEIESPFNTRRYAGLPPGPISNPGLSALRAVAFPAQTSYFYFQLRCDGSGRHVFATTYEEHLSNLCP